MKRHLYLKRITVAVVSALLSMTGLTIRAQNIGWNQPTSAPPYGVFNIGSATTPTEGGRAVCTDAAGNVYVSGIFGTGSDFDPSGGSFTLNAFNTTGNSADLFVAKYNASGQLQWAVRGGVVNSADNQSNNFGAICTDGTNVYVTGSILRSTTNGDWNFTPAAVGCDCSGTAPGSTLTEGYVAKLNANSGQWQWLKRWGFGTAFSAGYGVCLDGSGNVCLTGQINTNNSASSFGSAGSLTTSDADVFFGKLDAAGNWLWVNKGGGTGTDGGGTSGGTISYNSNLNRLTVTGSYNSTSPSFGTYSVPNTQGSSDMFLLEMNPANGTFLNAFGFGSSNTSLPDELVHCYDPFTKDIFVTGRQTGTLSTIPGIGSLSQATSGDDIFVGRYTPNSTTATSGAFAWAKSVGGTGNDRPWYIASNGAGGVLVGGVFQTSIAFGGSIGTITGSSTGNDAFVASFATLNGYSQWGLKGADADGTSANNDGIRGIVALQDGSGTAYAVGTVGAANSTAVTAFTPSAYGNALNITTVGGADIFFGKIFGGLPLSATQSQVNATCNGLCNGSATVVASGGKTPYTYSWSPSGGSGATASSLCAGNYTVTITDAWSNQITKTFTIGQPAAVGTPSASSNSPVCAGSNITLSASTVSGATYNWTGPGGYTATGQNVSRTNATTAMSGTYSVTATVGSCTGTAGTVVVTVNAAPATPAPSSNSPVCSGNTINLSTALVAGASYSWTGPNGFTSNQQNPSITNATTAMSGNYNVTVTTNGCTSAQGTVVVMVNAAPATPAPSSNSPVCSGNTINLSTALVSGASYSWTGPNGFTSNQQNPSITNATTAMSGNYNVTVTTNGCTSAQGTVSVTVNAAPATPAPSSNSPVCSGNTINLSTAIVAGASYSWTGPNGFTSNQQTPSITNATTAMSGNYNVTVTTNGCTSAQGTVSVTVNAAPATPAPSSNSPVCSGNTINLSTAMVSGASYSWTGPNGFTSNQQNPSITNATTAMSGNYNVTVTTNGCTSAPGSTSVTVQPTVTGSISGSTSICSGSSATLTITATGSGTLSGTLSNGASFSGTAPTITVSVSPMANTTYTIASMTNGTCAASAGNLTGSATVTINASGTWTGAVNGNWNTAGNWCGGIPTASTDVIIPASSSVPNSPSLSGTGSAHNVTVQSNGSLSLESGSTFNLYGTLANMGSVSIGSINLNLAATGNQSFPTSSSILINSLTINGGGVKTLNNNVTLSGSLNLTNGIVDVGSSTLALHNSAAINGASATNYVRTSATGGRLRQLVSTGTGPVTFPVGNTTYNPVTLSNAGTADNYLVGVRNQVLTEGTSGSQIDPGATYAINRTWDISEVTSGGSNVTMTLQWSMGQENTGSFDYTHVYISHYTGSSYDIPYANANQAPPANSVGGNVYRATRSGITSFSPFVVASAGGGAPLPVELINIAASNAGSRNQVEWTVANERNLAAYVVERSNDGKTFVRMEEVAATGKSGYITYDNAPNNGLTHYRLKMVDADGSFTYSKTVQAYMGRNGEVAITAAPNPIQDALTVNVYGAQDGKVQLSDVSGHIVISETLVNGAAVLSTGSLAAGTYFVQFSNGGTTKTLKVTKQ